MFKSARHALQFTFRTLGTPIIKMSGINNMRGSGGNSDMSPHDRHAQAAMIIAMMERVVDVNGVAYFKAKYGGEFNAGPDEAKIRKRLIRCVTASMPTGVHNVRGIAKLIIIYFGGDIGMSAVRTDFKCRNETCFEYRNIAFHTLDAIGVRAESDMHAALETAGLLDMN